MIGYLKNDRPQQTIDLFFQINKPDHVSFMLLFNACAQLRNETSLTLGKQVFQRLSNQSFHANSMNKILGAALDMFVKCNDTHTAESLFGRMKRNIISYGLLMKMYNDRNESDKTLSLFEQMKLEKIKPNSIIWLLIIKACAQLGDLSTSEVIFNQIPQHLLTNLIIHNALIDMWVRENIIQLISHLFFSDICRENRLRSTKLKAFSTRFHKQMSFHTIQ